MPERSGESDQLKKLNAIRRKLVRLKPKAAISPELVSLYGEIQAFLSSTFGKKSNELDEFARISLEMPPELANEATQVIKRMLPAAEGFVQKAEENYLKSQLQKLIELVDNCIHTLEKTR